MSATVAGVLFVVSLIVALARGLPLLRRLHVPGRHRHRALAGRAGHLPAGRRQPGGEQTWGVYARSVLAFSAVSILFLYGFLRLQDKLLAVPGLRR